MQRRRCDKSSSRRGAVGRRLFGRALLVFALTIAVVWIGGCGDGLKQAHEFESAGDWEGALAVYQQVLKGEPDDIAALSGASVALMVLQRFDEALSYQERVIAADPQDAQTRVELGFNYLNHQGRPLDAVRVLGEAAGLEPTAKNITFLAQAQMMAGDQVSAEGTLRHAIEVDPQYGYAYTVLAGLLGQEGRNDEATRLKDDARARGVEVVDL